MADQLGGVAGRVGELEAGLALLKYGSLVVEWAVMQENLHVPGVQPVAAELFAGTGDVGDQGFASPARNRSACGRTSGRRPSPLRGGGASSSGMQGMPRSSLAVRRPIDV